MRPQLIIQAKRILTSQQRLALKEKVKGELDADILVLDGSVDAVLSGVPYTFEERLGEYSWKAGVQTMDDLVKIVDSAMVLRKLMANNR